MAEQDYEDNKNTIKGKIYEMDDVKEYDSGYKKRDILIEYNNREFDGKKYSDIVKMKAEKQLVDQLNLLSVGDEVEVGWVLTGRMWQPQDRDTPINLTSAKILWINKLNVVPTTTGQAVKNQASEMQQEVPDDLPF